MLIFLFGFSSRGKKEIKSIKCLRVTFTVNFEQLFAQPTRVLYKGSDK